MSKPLHIGIIGGGPTGYVAAEDVYDQACHKPLKRQTTDQISDVSASKKSKSSC